MKLRPVLVFIREKCRSAKNLVLKVHGVSIVKSDTIRPPATGINTPQAPLLVFLQVALPKYLKKDLLFH
jgi:hypothetical protein